jgi:hypothetical protein
LIQKFASHGQCQFTLDNNIIIDAEGPWNVEFFKQMHANLQQVVLENFININYGIIVILKGETLATQEGLDYHLYKVKHGTAKAIAINMIHSLNLNLRLCIRRLALKINFLVTHQRLNNG